ncbi:uncharacterized protein LOC117340464 [Pecten maximus]|uniref:uncharacterized protein LOC117340464 n=1 Tax=Pecten maximus TaxID=6579 RepID=UPI001458D68A|nr:uncharacterized protein LOC117340464 [Pecten maximus]
MGWKRKKAFYTIHMLTNSKHQQLLITVLLQSFCNGQSDLTIQERTFGSAVVQAVTDRIRSSCIYSDDRLFIRRLAIVQSDDGGVNTTYRNGYYGGIWQIDEAKFNITRNCSSSAISQECSAILSEFNINWRTVQWTDLWKPLYSGLAASLYLKLQGVDPAPADLSSQAYLWTNHFQPAQSELTYTTKIQQAESTADGSCDYKPIDVVFIIDESGSVGSTNFNKTLNFLSEVVDNLNIGPSTVHVGLVKFSSFATLEFYLGTHSTKTSLKSAILNTAYRSGGTSIGAGIQHADKYVFPEIYGGRKDATKIAILVTDGVSSSASFTKQAADAAKDNHIRIFAVGIGRINIVELNYAASDPACTHVSVLTNFNQIDDIIYEIKKSACRASNQVGEEAEVDGVVTGEDGSTIQIDTGDGNNKTITTEVDCGELSVFSSFYTSHPGPAFYDQKDTAIEGSPSVFVVHVTDSRPLYITFVRLNPDPSCPNASYTVNVSNDHPTDTGTDIICKVNGKWQLCGSGNVDGDDDFNEICGVYENTDWNTISNPCKKDGDKYHSHPTDPAKFITCGDTQKMYITQCPVGKLYTNGGCAYAHRLSFGNIDHSAGSPVDALSFHIILCRVSGSLGECLSKDLPQDFYEKLCEGTTPSVQDPCTSCAISDGHLVHPFPLDDNKYITCEDEDNHLITQCPVGERFSVAKQGCISSTEDGDDEDSVEGNGNVNPCAEAVKLHKFYFPYPNDKTKFIQCDEWGHSFIMSCPSGQIWFDQILTCAVDTPGTKTDGGYSENSCTGNAGKTIAHSDPTKYINCDVSGIAHIMSCPKGLRFYMSLSRCDW